MPAWFINGNEYNWYCNGKLIDLTSARFPTIEIPETWVLIEISPTIVNVDRGTTQQFTANVTVSHPGSMDDSITWMVESSGGSSIDQNGLLTVGVDEQPYSQIRVIAQSNFNPSYEADAEAVVSDLPVLTIVVNPYTVTMDRGRTQQFTATVSAPSGTPTTVTWSVIGATASTITSNGLFSLSADEAKGAQIRIRATSTAYPSIYNEATVTVSQVDLPTVVSVVVSPATVSVNRNSTTQFTATATVLAGASQVVTWSITGNTSSNTNISTSGSLRVHNQQTSGSTIIVTARSTFDNTKFGTATVSVR